MSEKINFMESEVTQLIGKRESQQFTFSKVIKENDIFYPSNLPQIILNTQFTEKEYSNKKDIFIKINGFFNSVELKTKIKVDLQKKVDDFITEIFINKIAHYNLDPKEFILKSLGEESFIYGNHKLISFDYIQKCLEKKVEPELVLIEKESVYNETHQKQFDLSNISYEFEDFDIKKTKYEHDKIKFDINSIDKMSVISLFDLSRNLKMLIKRINLITVSDNIKNKFDNKLEDNAELYIHGQLYYGSEIISEGKTKDIKFSFNPKFYDYLEFGDILLRNLPKESRIVFTLYLKDKNKDFNVNEDQPLYHVSKPLFDFDQKLIMGENNLNFFNTEKNQNTNYTFLTDLTVEFDSFAYNVVYPDISDLPKIFKNEFDIWVHKQTKLYEKTKTFYKMEVDKIIKNYTPLNKLTDEEKFLIFNSRDYLINNSKALPIFLKSVNTKLLKIGTI
jgi:hypothetical protein